ncbi:MAG TPA: hypothetical protein VN223_07915, partial [Candidatus Elarobacter sp.]|nr:hypothetical protein [Candidatus Elarobacter sp.]
MAPRWLLSLCSLIVLNTVAYSQCYDLRSTRLYEAKGRYQEHWDKPLWGGQTGNENFRVDAPTWGRVFHFAVFEIGIVRKTPGGWISYRAKRAADSWCDPAPERSGMLCYSKQYQEPPSQATVHVIGFGVESWSLDKDGIVHYRYRDDQGVPAKVENRSGYKLIPHEFGFEGKDLTDATLDLNTGEYQFESHQYFDGGYIRRYPGTGVKLWKIDTFQAHATLHEIACPVAIKSASLVDPNDAPSEVTMKMSETCVAKVKETRAEGVEIVPTSWDFIQNPGRESAPERCVQVFESPQPQPASIATIPAVHAQSPVGL